jgi:hypothetical protein
MLKHEAFHVRLSTIMSKPVAAVAAFINPQMRERAVCSVHLCIPVLGKEKDRQADPVVRCLMRRREGGPASMWIPGIADKSL